MDKAPYELFELQMPDMYGEDVGPGGSGGFEPMWPSPLSHGFRALARGNLFIAILAPPQVQTKILDVAIHDCHIYSLAGHFVPLECLHISLAGIVEFESELPPVEYVEAAMYVAGRIQMQPFEVTLDRTANFSGRDGRSPYVLTVGYGKDKVTELHLLLAMQLRKMGIRFRSSYNPHVTMLYDRVRPPPHEIAPISWSVGEFALVHSHVGQSRYTVLKRWPLVR